MAESSGNRDYLVTISTEKVINEQDKVEYALHQECLWLLSTVPHVSLTAMGGDFPEGKKTEVAS